MIGAGAISTPLCVPFRSQEWNSNSSPRILSGGFTVPPLYKALHPSPLSNLTPRFNLQPKPHSSSPNFLPKAASSSSSSSVESTEYTEEPATKLRFQKSLALPGCSTSLALLGTGYREKVFAIIGVKVYAAGLYVNQSVFNHLDAWKGQSAAKIQEDKLLFDTIFQASLEKSLQIVLVRDVDGKTFWDALDEAISPRVKSPTSVDETALSTFRSIFQGRALKKGTSVFLTWLDPSKMLVHVSSDGIPFSVNATIESANITSALFDVFLGSDPVSPPLKASVANSLASTLK